MSTAIHALVERCRAGTHAPLVSRVSCGWWVLGEQQVLPGYSLLLPDPVVPHLNALTEPSRTRFLAEMTAIGDVLQTVCVALRINYAMFGNVEPALHAHLFPRRAAEPESMRTLQPWALDWMQAPRYSVDVHGELRHALASAWSRR